VVEIALVAAAAVLVLGIFAETIHGARVRKVAALAFGPARRPALFARLAPAGRVLAMSSLAFGLSTLLLIEPAKHSLDGSQALADPEEHVLLVLDVSPSMRLVDAGPQKNKSRMQRAREVMESFFSRIPLERYRVSVVAVYNGARPVVVDTSDVEVVRNILGELPMHYAFQSGSTRLFDGLEEASRIAKPWGPRSTTLVILSDGDTVPASGMPKMPASIGHAFVVGVGDPVTGKFIDGRQSRQDVSTLRHLAVRLQGTFHNGNEKHLPSDVLSSMLGESFSSPLERLTIREYALIACGLGAGLLALLPWLLHALGTSWRPGVPLSVRVAVASPGRSARTGR